MSARDRQETDADVLIVGGGPVGLTAALLCARLGLSCVILERRERKQGPPRAHAVNPRTLEICRALGIDRNVFAARSMPPEQGGYVRFVTGLTGLELGSLPYERQDPGALAFTPTPLVNIPQPHFEDILLERVAGAPSIELRRRHSWVSADQTAAGVSSTVSDGDGNNCRISSRYVLACDGAESSVRKSLSIGMPGTARIEDRIMIHFEADLRPLLGDRPAVLYFVVNPAAPATLIAYLMESTFVLMHRYDSAKEPVASFTAERCHALVRDLLGTGDIPVEIRHISPWTMTALIAERYRKGRIFLVGDAAHRFPPSGGFGLNSGVQDAHNLVWKIAAVESKWAGPALLDSYERERRFVAEVYSAQSHKNAIEMGKLFQFAAAQYGASDGSAEQLATRLSEARRDGTLPRLIEQQRPHFDSFGLQLGFSYAASSDWPAHVSDYAPTIATGARLPHTWITRSGERASTLDLLGLDRFTLLCGARPARWREAADGVAAPLRIAAVGAEFEDPEGSWAALVGSNPTSAILVRPDGHMACVAADDSENNRLEVSRALRPCGA
jgi:2,4-dichlorophenol 6-monooxygenase